MSGPTTQRFDRADLPFPRRGPQLVLLSPSTASAPPVAAATTDRSHPAGSDPVSAQLRLSAHSCLARTSGHPLQPQDGLSTPQTPSLAGVASLPHPTPRTTARRQSGGASIQSALGLRHHHVQTLERSKTPAGRHHRLRRPHDPGLEITATTDHTGGLRTAPRSDLPAFCPAPAAGQRPGVPHRQRIGIYRGPTPAAFEANGTGRLPHVLPQSPIQRLGRILLRQFQTRLSFAPTFGNFGRGHEARPRLDYPLQRSRSSQRSGHVLSSHFLSTMVDRITHKNYINPCPVLTGPHHH